MTKAGGPACLWEIMVDNLVKRTLRELNEEIAYISRHLRHWWQGMSDSEQLFFVCIISATLLLLGLRKPTKRRLNHYDESAATGILKQFMFSAVVLIIFTYAISLAVNDFT